MNQPRMFSNGKHSRGLTPQAVQLFLHYTQFYIKAGKAKLEEYHRQIQEAKIPPDPGLVASVEAKIAEAEEVEKAFQEVAGALQNVHDCNFRAVAQVIRSAMLELGYRRIEDSQELYLLTTLVMRWLKSQNELFSKQKFINFINYGKETIEEGITNEEHNVY